MNIVLASTIISFLLESITSNFISLNNQIFIPLFSLISLVIIYPYFRTDKLRYIKACAILGFFYDIVFTDTLIMNLLLFSIIGFIISFINKIFSNNVISIVVISAIIILCYRFMSYSILCISGLFEFYGNRLWESIYSSMILNIIYAIVLYIITDILARKYHIRKID